MKGISLIEILLVVGVLAILVSIILPLALDFYREQQLDTHSQGIIQTLRKAQLKTMSIENDSSFGVYLTDDSYTLFKGDSYTNRDTQYDEILDLPVILTLSGLQELIFSKFEGRPNVTGNIVLNSNNKSRIISINNFGMISLIPAAPSLPPSHLTQIHYRWRNDDGGE